MSRTSPRSSLTQVLTTAAASYQAERVIPHCPQCSKPCCALDALVLELDWQQVKPLWQIEESRAAFDKRLAAGKGPVEIRPWEGRYYVHSKPCPAYDLKQKNCKVYGQDIKPPGCSDFPVYEDAGSLMVDLRCEAVVLDDLARQVADAVGPAWRIVRSADEEFPFLVTLSAKKPRKPGK